MTELQRCQISEMGLGNLLESQVRGAARVRSLPEGSLTPGDEIAHVRSPSIHSFTHSHHCQGCLASQHATAFHTLRIKLEPRSLARPCPSFYPLPHLPSAPFLEPSPSPRPADCSLIQPCLLNLIISSNSSIVKVPILGNGQAAFHRGAPPELRPHPTYLPAYPSCPPTRPQW